MSRFWGGLILACIYNSEICSTLWVGLYSKVGLYSHQYGIFTYTQGCPPKLSHTQIINASFLVSFIFVQNICMYVAKMIEWNYWPHPSSVSKTQINFLVILCKPYMSQKYFETITVHLYTQTKPIPWLQISLWIYSWQTESLPQIIIIYITCQHCEMFK